jgi:predicted aspartyl protease
MLDEMGTFRTDVEVANPVQALKRKLIRSVLVDTGAELSWFPASLLRSLGITRLKEWQFRQAGGTVLSRWTGAALVYAGGTMTNDEVVFGEPGDLVLLGARSLEGLNLRIDPVRKQLVDAGPAPAAAIVWRRPAQPYLEPTLAGLSITVEALRAPSGDRVV